MNMNEKTSAQAPNSETKTFDALFLDYPLPTDIEPLIEEWVRKMKRRQLIIMCLLALAMRKRSVKRFT